MKKLVLSVLMMSSAAFGAKVTKSNFHWEGKKIIGDKHHGTIQLKESTVEMKDKKLVSAKFVMDMDSIDCSISRENGDKILSHKNETGRMRLKRYIYC